MKIEATIHVEPIKEKEGKGRRGRVSPWRRLERHEKTAVPREDGGLTRIVIQVRAVSHGP
jgi:hypothetical protein